MIQTNHKEQYKWKEKGNKTYIKRFYQIKALQKFSSSILNNFYFIRQNYDGKICVTSMDSVKNE